MSGKSCGIPSNQYPKKLCWVQQDYIIYNRVNKTNNTTLQIVNAIKENRK